MKTKKMYKPNGLMEILFKNLPDYFTRVIDGKYDRGVDVICEDIGGVIRILYDFFNTFFENRFVCLAWDDITIWEGISYMAEVADFVKGGAGPCFCELSIPLSGPETDGVFNVLVSGESTESIESELQTRLVEYLTVRRVHEE